MDSAPDVFNAAMALSSEQRAKLAHELILSLEPAGADENVEQAWAEEIGRRRQAIREGQALLDWDEALAEVRQSIVRRAEP